MGVVAILVVAAGFYGTARAAVYGVRSMTPLVYLHAAIALAWLFLYLVQASLIAARRTTLHRRLGMSSVFLAVAFVVTGCLTAIAAAQRGYGPVFDGTPDPLGTLIHTLGDVLSFSITVVAGLAYRRRPEIHKRLMLLVVVGPMMNAPLLHFFVGLRGLPARPLLYIASMAALLFAPAVYDRVTRGRFNPVTLWGAVALFAFGNVRAAIGSSDAWRRLAESLTS
jgi:hypothetical protein